MEIRIFEIHSLTVDLGVQLLVDGRECYSFGIHVRRGRRYGCRGVRPTAAGCEMYQCLGVAYLRGDCRSPAS